MAKRKKSANKDKKWDDGAKRASRGNFDYPKLSLEKGRNYFALAVDDYAEVYQHWLKKPDGGSEKIRSFNCAGGPEGEGDCPDECAGCALESGDLDTSSGAYVDNTRHRYVFKVLPVKYVKKGGKKIPRVSEKEIQVLEVGPMIFNGVKNSRADIREDETGEYAEKGVTEITQVVLEVQKTGSGRDTEYTVRLRQKIDTQKTLDSIEDTCPDFDELGKPDSNSKIRAFIGADSSDSDDEEDIDLGDGDDEEDEGEDEDEDDIDLDMDDEDEDEDEDEEDEDEDEDEDES